MALSFLSQTFWTSSSVRLRVFHHVGSYDWSVPRSLERTVMSSIGGTEPFGSRLAGISRCLSAAAFGSHFTVPCLADAELLDFSSEPHADTPTAATAMPAITDTGNRSRRCLSRNSLNS